MKKLYLILLLMFAFGFQPVMAKTVSVQAMDDFSTENPVGTMKIKMLETLELDENTTFDKDYIVEGKIIDVTDPKRLKRNASFTFVPLNYKDTSGKIVDIKGYYPAKYTTKIDKGELAKSAALGVGNMFVKGLSVGYNAVEGAVKNEQGNRFKSSVTEVYEGSPLSYVQKGEQIEIKKEQNFYLNFKAVSEEEDLPNYEYEELPE